jgi:ribosomal protein S8
MSMTDPIADFLTRIRNAIHASHETVLMPGSRQKSELARILAEQGYIDAYSVAPATGAPGEVLEIRLKYDDSRRSAISGLRRVSRPGRRACPRRNGYRDRLDLARRDDRPRGPRCRSWRRGRGGGLVNVADR